MGRAADNELSLPDPERHLSRVQARVDFNGGSFCLVDLGRNPTQVDGRTLGRGERVSLSGGEIITMGAYLLLVELTAATPASNRTANAEGVTDDPFAVFGPAQPSIAPEPVTDPFPIAVQAADARRDELGLGMPAGAASVDELFGLPASPYDPLAGTPLGSTNRHKGQAQDPLQLLGGAWPASDHARPAPQRDDAPLLRQAFVPPRPPERASVEAADAGRDLRDAFMRGLGVQLELPDGLTPLLMEQVGLLLREAMQGTLDLLGMRAGARREVRAETTMISGRDGNPLKFSPDLAFALMQLLTGPGQGFMDARRAMRDAYDDLRAHQSGQSLLEACEQQVDPLQDSGRSQRDLPASGV